MNEYFYNEISLGQQESFSVVVTPLMMDGFMSITGDSNPLHQYSEYARSSGFYDRVVYGMLTASFLSTLAGMYLPGEHSLIKEVNFKLPAPVYVDDELLIVGEVVEKNDTFNLIDVKVTITNQDNRKVLRGNMQIVVSK